MYLILGRPKTISALAGKTFTPVGSLRAQVPIVIIDDEGFLYADVLRNHEFQLRVLNDISDVKAVESYPIIICDIKGIGSTFGSKYEGAHVLAEIRKHYPSKYLIAHTGQLFDASYNSYFALCDAVVKKDADSEVWVATLDAALKTYANPVEQWKKIRALLVGNNIDTAKILDLEDSYVSSIIKKQRPFQDPNKLSNIPEDVKAVLLGVASNVIFKLLGF